MKYRNEFGKDIVVDLVCFRRYGHNELDEPMFTNPLLYKKINVRRSVPDLYKEKIAQQENLIEMSQLDSEVSEYRKYLENCFNQIDTFTIPPRNTYLQKKWSSMDLPSPTNITTWQTGLNKNFLKLVGTKSVEYPSEFVIILISFIYYDIVTH